MNHSSNGVDISYKFEVFQQLLNEQRDHFWVPPGMDKFKDDTTSWWQMNPKVRYRIKLANHLLAKLEPEIVVNLDIILGDIIKKLPNSEVISRCIRFQQAMEDIHTEAYDRIDRELTSYIRHQDLEKLRKKVQQLQKYRDSSASVSLVAQTCCEGISFVGLFPLYSYLRKDMNLPETCLTNLEVLKDENMHTKVFYTLYRILVDLGLIERLPQKEVYEIVSSFIEIEDEIAELIYGNQDEEEKRFFTVMNNDNYKTYARITANFVLKALGYEELYDVSVSDNPFHFVNDSLLDTVIGFFDTDSADYGMITDHHYISDSDPEDD